MFEKRIKYIRKSLIQRVTIVHTWKIFEINSRMKKIQFNINGFFNNIDIFSILLEGTTKNNGIE